jgi:hypothetical protein
MFIGRLQGKGNFRQVAKEIEEDPEEAYKKYENMKQFMNKIDEYPHPHIDKAIKQIRNELGFLPEDQPK